MKKGQDLQIGSKIYVMGQKAEGGYNTSQLVGEYNPEANENVLQQFDCYFLPRVNTIHEREQIYQWFQTNTWKLS